MSQRMHNGDAPVVVDARVAAVDATCHERGQTGHGGDDPAVDATKSTCHGRRWNASQPAEPGRDDSTQHALAT